MTARERAEAFKRRWYSIGHVGSWSEQLDIADLEEAFKEAENHGLFQAILPLIENMSLYEGLNEVEVTLKVQVVYNPNPKRNEPLLANATGVKSKPIPFFRGD